MTAKQAETRKLILKSLKQQGKTAEWFISEMRKEIDKLAIIEAGGTDAQRRKAGQNIRAAKKDLRLYFGVEI